uniref:Uncharacterized protein n=1 Tax=Anopheles culicifacies TaxID=139723 RepID=A0A182M9X1_9DIPT
MLSERKQSVQLFVRNQRCTGVVVPLSLRVTRQRKHTVTLLIYDHLLGNVLSKEVNAVIIGCQCVRSLPQMRCAIFIETVRNHNRLEGVLVFDGQIDRLHRVSVLDVALQLYQCDIVVPADVLGITDQHQTAAGQGRLKTRINLSLSGETLDPGKPTEASSRDNRNIIEQNQFVSTAHRPTICFRVCPTEPAKRGAQNFATIIVLASVNSRFEGHPFFPLKKGTQTFHHRGKRSRSGSRGRGQLLCTVLCDTVASCQWHCLRDCLATDQQRVLTVVP